MGSQKASETVTPGEEGARRRLMHILKTTKSVCAMKNPMD